MFLQIVDHGQCFFNDLKGKKNQFLYLFVDFRTSSLIFFFFFLIDIKTGLDSISFSVSLI